MDDCLSKPVQMAQLGTTLARWLPSAPTAPPSPAAAPDARDLPAFDPTALARLIGDDSELLAEFGRDYLASARALADEVRTASAQGEWAQVGAVAHKLKSSSRAVGALALGDCCERLELAGQAGDAEAVRALQPGFEATLEAVIAGLGGEAGSAATATRAAATGVLLVDDEPFYVEMLQRQLSMLGVAPVQALRSGESALEWLNGRDTSALLLLLDLDMPGMDGVEFMRHLAERRFAGALALISGADVRVLETASKLARAHQLSVLTHLHKPVNSDTLRELLQRWHGFTPALVRRRGKAYEAQELLRAIDAGELLLHYQPKVTLADGVLVGVEALVRWQHPVDGLVYPDSFIGTAESSGLIDALTRGVLTMALAQLRRWHDSGLALRMAVNISMNNLARLDFAEFVFDELARHCVPPTALVLEVTESQLASDVRAQMDILTRMRLRQVGLSIDDFGTGHSSLAQLRDMPFDELKIDRGFVHGGGSNPTQSAIFGASLALAHQIGMKVVAEGVEDRADWEFVRAAGCDIAQGYFVARPMPADELLDWAARWQRRFEVM
ncbi:MAG TPA: EAL domain-containing protein [Caldimonas sp.]